MHPANCPEWEYKHHPNARLLPARCAKILIALRSGLVDIDSTTHDTRTHHAELFIGTTPAGHPYFAGHYRGEPFRCLKFLLVGIPGDPRVGTPPEMVTTDVSNLSDNIIRPGIAAIHQGFTYPDAQLSPAEKLYYLAVFACRVLVEFLRIHPYANGNGHMARLLIWLLFAKFGYWPKRWPLNTRPPYVTLIELYRNGQTEFLEKFVLQCVLG